MKIMTRNDFLSVFVWNVGRVTVCDRCNCIRAQGAACEYISPNHYNQKVSSVQKIEEFIENNAAHKHEAFLAGPLFDIHQVTKQNQIKAENIS